MEQKNKLYFKNIDGSEQIYYMVQDTSKSDVNIIEVNDSAIIIYDTRISKSMVEKKFGNLELQEIAQEDFDAKIIERLNRSKT